MSGADRHGSVGLDAMRGDPQDKEKDMQALDVQEVVDMAVAIARQEADLRFQEIELDVVEDGLDEASPKNVERRCRRVMLANMTIVRIQSTIPETDDALARLKARLSGQPAIVETIARMAEQCAGMSARTMAARRQARRIGTTTFEILDEMRRQPLPERLIRIAGEAMEPKTIAEMLRKVEKDHEAVSSARATWRQMRDPGPVLMIRETSTHREVADALRALETMGCASRRRRIFGATRWSVGQATEGKGVRQGGYARHD